MSFGFQVRRIESTRLEPPPTDDEWAVWLPHQCDGWDIAGDGWHGLAHAGAVAELERFIAEAQEALAALRERRELA